MHGVGNAGSLPTAEHTAYWGTSLTICNMLMMAENNSAEVAMITPLFDRQKERERFQASVH